MCAKTTLSQAAAADDRYPMTVTVYGIRNCDTMKKARAWLDAHAVAYRFHDYKVDGIGAESLHHWCAVLGWKALLNRSGTTYRRLPEAARQVSDANQAIALMLAQPSMVRRPVLEVDSRLLVGFKPDDYARALGG